MATKPESTGASKKVKYPAGQRLTCHNCGSEIEIISPCTCDPPDQVLRCCGQDMAPTTGSNVHLNVE
jgi:hypothetical protein